MLEAARDDVDARRIDTAVSQDIREPRDVFLYAVKGSGEQVPQIVREHLAGVDAGFLAEALHLPPDIRSVHQLACLGNENRSLFNVPLSRILQKLSLQLLHDKNPARLALAGDDRLAALRCLHGDKPELAHADPCAANGLQEHLQPLIAFLLRSTDEPEIFLSGEFLLLRAVDLSLCLDGPDLAVGPSQIREQAAQRSKHGINSSDRIASRDQFLLVRNQSLSGYALILDIVPEGADVAKILLDRRPALFFPQKVRFKSPHLLLRDNSLFHI